MLPSTPSSSAHWHTISWQEAVASHASDSQTGLSSEEATLRFQTDGPNRLAEVAERSLFYVFLTQFKSPLIYLLFVAAAMALALAHVKDAVVIQPKRHCSPSLVRQNPVPVMLAGN